MIPLTLASGQAAWLTLLEGERLALSSERAFAPGARVEASGPGLWLRFKVHRCVREGDRFRIEGRAIDLTKEMRQAFVAALAGDSG